MEPSWRVLAWRRSETGWRFARVAFPHARYDPKAAIAARSTSEIVTLVSNQRSLAPSGSGVKYRIELGPVLPDIRPVVAAIIADVASLFHL